MCHIIRKIRNKKQGFFFAGKKSSNPDMGTFLGNLQTDALEGEYGTWKEKEITLSLLFTLLLTTIVFCLFVLHGASRIQDLAEGTLPILLRTAHERLSIAEKRWISLRGALRDTADLMLFFESGEGEKLVSIVYIPPETTSPLSQIGVSIPIPSTVPPSPPADPASLVAVIPAENPCPATFFLGRFLAGEAGDIVGFWTLATVPPKICLVQPGTKRSIPFVHGAAYLVPSFRRILADYLATPSVVIAFLGGACLLFALTTLAFCEFGSARGYLYQFGAISRMVEERDTYTHEHVRRVSDYATRIAKGIGLKPDVVRKIRLAAAAHDCGKVFTPTEILGKKSALTEEEMQIMRVHAADSGGLVRAITNDEELARIVRAHHERWDGTGYPDGLSGEQIPRESRILAAADVLDACLSDRPYRKGLSVSEVLAYFQKERGGHFEPHIADYVVENMDAIRHHESKEDTRQKEVPDGR
jgi:HD-GYP domain-containing protein (c-di-GMP phosphodiesterase class II)